MLRTSVAKRAIIGENSEGTIGWEHGPGDIVYFTIDVGNRMRATVPVAGEEVRRCIDEAVEDGTPAAERLAFSILKELKAQCVKNVYSNTLMTRVSKVASDFLLHW